MNFLYLLLIFINLINSKVIFYNCFTRELWTEEKRIWCCIEKNLGCYKSLRASESQSLK